MKPEKTGKSRKLFIIAIVAICLVAVAAEIILISGASKKKAKKKTDETGVSGQESQKTTATPTVPVDPTKQMYTVWRMTKHYCPDPSGKEMLYQDWEYQDQGRKTIERIYDPYSGQAIYRETWYREDWLESFSNELSDGKEIEKRQRQYDEAGRVVWEFLSQTGIDGETKYITEWTRRGDGQIVKEDRYIGEGKTWDYTVTYSYDLNNQKTEYAMETAGGLHEKIRYTYDADGNLTREETVFPDGSIGDFTVYQYEDGRLVKEEKYMNADTLMWLYGYEYDREGRLIRKNYNDAPSLSTHQYTMWHIYGYDEKDRVIRETGYGFNSPNGDGIIDDYECFYDENGCKVKEIFYDTYGTGNDSVHRYEYVELTVPYCNLTDEEKAQLGLR